MSDARRGRFELRRDGRTIARHSTKLACVVEAIERGWVMRHRSSVFPLAGVEFVSVEERAAA